MNETNSEPLDRLLREWADRHAADEETLERLRGEICRTLAGGEPAAAESPRQSPRQSPAPLAAPRQTWHHPIIWFSLGAAAALLLAVSISMYFRLNTSGPDVAVPNATGPDVPAPKIPPPNTPKPPRPNSPHDNPALLAEITPEQIAHEKKLFAELERMFGERLQWVAESNGSIELGIDPDAGAAEPARTAEPLTVRFTVVRRQPGEQRWQVVWTVNLVTRNEQVVRYRPENGDSPSLSVWTFALPDGKIACDAELSFNGDTGLRLNTSDLQSPGEVAEVASAADDGAEYRVFQTIQLLSDEVI